MFFIQLLIDMFRRPFAYLGLAMVVLAYMMGWYAIVHYHSLPFREREANLVFALIFYFLGFATLATQVVMEAEGQVRKSIAGSIVFGGIVMAGWVLVGPFIEHPFLGLSLFRW